jgi:hypothetical protein
VVECLLLYKALSSNSRPTKKNSMKPRSQREIKLNLLARLGLKHGILSAHSLSQHVSHLHPRG